MAIPRRRRADDSVSRLGISDPAGTARWAYLLDDTVTVTPTGHDTARTVREAVHRCAKALIAGNLAAEAAEALINAAAATAPLVPVLRRGAARLTVPATDAEAAALNTVACDAIDLFTGALAERIRERDSPECALLCVDTSRPGRRRWCSSAACGSKDRSAAYRRRRQAGAPA
ncbi:ABATE domain-containing protein [Micromonospora sp. NPDC003776]